MQYLDAQVVQARDHALLELGEGYDGARHQAGLLQEDLGGGEGHGVQEGGQPAGREGGNRTLGHVLVASSPPHPTPLTHTYPLPSPSNPLACCCAA